MQKFSCSPMVPRQDLHHEWSVATCEPLQRHLQASLSLLHWCPKVIYLPQASRPGLSKKHINTFWYLSVSQCSLASLWAFGFTLHQTTQHYPRVGCQMCRIYFCSLIACDGSSQTETSPGPGPLSQLPCTHCSGYRSPNRLATFVTCLEVILEMSWCCCPVSGPGMQNYSLNILKANKVCAAVGIQRVNEVCEDPESCKGSSHSYLHTDFSR